MTQEFNHPLYAKLLIENTPRVIESEEEYNRLLPIVERLTFAKNLTPEEKALYRLLVLLLETYETKEYPIESKPHEILQHIMESSGTRQADLVGAIGSSEVVSDIVEGKKPITEIQARLLGDLFKISSELFL
jgi:HTH-type transcriptional regulator/antitoxin HigA